MSAWSDHVETDSIDHDAFLFMGADPEWTPAREEKLADAPDKPAGRCRLCGGDRGFPLLDAVGNPVVGYDGSPIVISEVPPGSHRVCARCMRSGDDQHSQGVRPGGGPSVVPRDEAGYVSRDGVSVPERYAGMLLG